jgi:hypothetical protein
MTIASSSSSLSAIGLSRSDSLTAAENAHTRIVALALVLGGKLAVVFMVFQGSEANVIQ